VIIVANTTPIISLASIHHLELLEIEKGRWYSNNVYCAILARAGE